MLAAVRIQYPSTTDIQINTKIGAFLAQSADREGGRKERALKQRPTDNAADASDAGSVGSADDEQ